jgi:hypothetical protein
MWRNVRQQSGFRSGIDSTVSFDSFVGHDRAHNRSVISLTNVSGFSSPIWQHHSKCRGKIFKVSCSVIMRLNAHPITGNLVSPKLLIRRTCCIGECLLNIHIPTCGLPNLSTLPRSDVVQTVVIDNGLCKISLGRRRQPE